MPRTPNYWEVPKSHNNVANTTIQCICSPEGGAKLSLAPRCHLTSGPRAASLTKPKPVSRKSHFLTSPKNALFNQTSIAKKSQDPALPGLGGLPNDRPPRHGEACRLASDQHHLHDERDHWEPWIRHLPALPRRGWFTAFRQTGIPACII